MHPRLQCSSTGADVSCQGICARFSLHYLFFCTGINRRAFVSTAAGCCFPRRDALNGGSSMTLGSKGMERSSDSHRRRMPWTAAKEYVPGVVHSSKEKMVLDGAQRVDLECVDCASQVYPLEALRAAVASYEYNTFRGKNIFNWSRRWNPMCSGNGLLQGMAGGDARRERHSHRHSFPSPPDHNAARANTPCGFSEVARAVLLAVIVPHPRASVQTSLSIAGTHPLIDAADTAAHCWCFLDDCCTAPAAGTVGLGTRTQQTKFSQLVLAALSASRLTQRPTHTTDEHRNRRDREGINGVSEHQLSSDFTSSQATG
ncbi:hypothetical protein TcG_05770 [Trypanosoma cruzi]|nr:hypothetical protein TcG_05770 [Trypanosoma cruzi]